MALFFIFQKRGEISEWNTVVHQNYKSAKECVETNFFGAEKVTEALLPLLQLSASPRIVNVSARIFGQLKVKYFHFTI
jgi:(+)-neomenthol dehydrogenase